jgi:fumarylpyruvate hydrolase
MLEARMSFVFEPAPQAFATIDAGGRFPIRRIFCVGRNYADHVREMGNDPKSEPPIFFTKPGDAVVPTGAAIPYALNTENLHYEVELVLAIGKTGVNLAEADALTHVWGYGVGVDLTRRDRQGEAKKAGAPWDVGKAFDESAPLSALTQASPSDGARIWLSVNGVTKQDAKLSDMIWSVSEIVAHLSRSWTLQPGDLVYTGTPAGVGPIVPGDAVTCGVDGLPELAFKIVSR